MSYIDSDASKLHNYVFSKRFFFTDFSAQYDITPHTYRLIRNLLKTHLSRPNTLK